MIINMKKSLFNLFALFIIAVNVLAQEATFESLGVLPGGQNSMAHAVSADGTIVVGQSESSLGPMSGIEAFRWNENEGIVGLGDLPGGIFTSFAHGVSSDGNIIVGTGWGDGFTEALRWENNVMEGIGFLPGGTDSFAYDVSDDGLTIVGYGFDSDGFSMAFRWTQASGIEGIGFLPGGSESTGFDVSGDGSVVAGYAMRNDGFYEAFRWTESGGMEGLGDLPGGNIESYAWGVSSDGSTVVGWSSTGPVDYEAFRWTEAGGMESIGDLPGGGTFGMARATSADGSIIVGEGLIDGGSVAFYWTENEGMRNLQEMLENDYGLDLQGWTLSYASSVSDDGRTIVGYAVNPSGQTEAFRVVLPEATSCQAPGSFFLDEVTESTASFSWNSSPSDVSGYNWFVMNLGESPDMNDPVAGGTTLSWMTWATATDLTPDTMYHVYLQTSCDGGEQSDYAGPFMITTTGGGDECGHSTPSNNFELAQGFLHVLEFAHDFKVDAGNVFTLHELTVNVIHDFDAEIGLVDIHIYEDNDGAGPGEEIGSYMGIVPTITNVYPEIPLIIDAVSVDLSSYEISLEGGEDGKTYWIGFFIPSYEGFMGTYWESTTNMSTSEYGAYHRLENEPWTQGNPIADGVYTLTGECSVLSVNDTLKDQIILYPNPTTGIINLQTKEKISSVSVYNSAGQKVSFNSLNKENTSIDISNLSSGVYFVEITNDKTVKRHKVIKK